MKKMNTNFQNTMGKLYMDEEVNYDKMDYVNCNNINYLYNKDNYSNEQVMNDLQMKFKVRFEKLYFNIKNGINHLTIASRDCDLNAKLITKNKEFFVKNIFLVSNENLPFPCRKSNMKLVYEITDNIILYRDVVYDNNVCAKFILNNSNNSNNNLTDNLNNNILGIMNMHSARLFGRNNCLLCYENNKENDVELFNISYQLYNNSSLKHLGLVSNSQPLYAWYHNVPFKLNKLDYDQLYLQIKPLSDEDKVAMNSYGMSTEYSYYF